MILGTDRVYQYDMQDAGGRLRRESITPARIAQIVDHADYSNLSEWLELWQEMVARDSHLYTVWDKRRKGITGVPWRIVAPVDAPDAEVAEFVAGGIEKLLRSIDSIDDIIWHLSSAIGPNVAMVEKVFHGDRLVDLVAIPPSRIGQWLWESPGIRLKSSRADVKGELADAAKYIVNHPHGMTISPTYDCPMRPALLLWVGKHFNWKDWLHYAEKFGWPFVTGEVSPNTDAASKRKLEQVIQSLASDRVAVMEAGSAIDISHVPHLPNEPFLPLIEYVNSEMSKLFLGQTMTTESPDVGAYALGKIHKDVEASLAYADYMAEQRCWRSTLKQLTQLMFGDHAPCPVWFREIDTKEDIQTISAKYDGAKSAGIKAFSMRQIVSDYGIDVPIDDDDTVELASVGGDGTAPVTVNDLTLAIERLTRSGDLEMVNKTRDRLAVMLGVASPVPLAELPKNESQDQIS